MKYLSKYHLLIAFSALLLSSCDQEQPIDLDLDEATPQYVIEGRVSTDSTPYTVHITKTVHFDQPNDFPAVGGALVVISDNTGKLDTLFETSAGVYETANARPGIPGNTYTLQVWVEGQYFAASSTIPEVVLFEDLRAIRLPFGSEQTLVMTPVFTDPSGLGNNYQFIQSNNGKQQPFIFVTDDRNNDGSRISNLLLAPDLKTNPGDTVTIEMRTIDRATYKYFVALDASNGNGPNASVPANPANNFGGACLGYFAAYTVQRKSLIAE